MQFSDRTEKNGAVTTTNTVVLTPGPTDPTITELRAALAVVYKFEQEALKACRTTRKGSDWTMFEFSCHHDQVTVTLKQGACG